MAYCTFADVDERLPHIGIDEYSTPTQTEVESWIEDLAEGEIDPQIRAVVALPVTDSVGLEYLKRINLYLVISEVYKTLEVDSEYASSFRAMAERMLQNALKRPNILQSPATGGALPSSHTRTMDPDDSSEYIFRRGEKQW
jgi:hypothetical protein